MTLEIVQAGISTDSVKTKSSTASKSGFADTLGIAAASFGGPAMMVASEKDTSTQAITMAAVNAASGGAYLASGSQYANPSYLSTGGLGYSSLGSYSTGGASLTRSDTSTISSASDLQAMLADNQVNSAMMIGIQAQMGQDSVQTNAISNVVQMKYQNMLAVIRNLKQG